MAQDLTVVAIYDGNTREFKELLLVMTQEQEITENWNSGENLELSAEKYVLGKRRLTKKGLIVHYELIKKE